MGFLTTRRRPEQLKAISRNLNDFIEDIFDMKYVEKLHLFEKIKSTLKHFTIVHVVNGTISEIINPDFNPQIFGKVSQEIANEVAKTLDEEVIRILLQWYTEDDRTMMRFLKAEVLDLEETKQKLTNLFENHDSEKCGGIWIALLFEYLDHTGLHRKLRKLDVTFSKYKKIAIVWTVYGNLLIEKSRGNTSPEYYRLNTRALTYTSANLYVLMHEIIHTMYAEFSLLPYKPRVTIPKPWNHFINMEEFITVLLPVILLKENYYKHAIDLFAKKKYFRERKRSYAYNLGIYIVQRLYEANGKDIKKMKDTLFRNYIELCKILPKRSKEEHIISLEELVRVLLGTEYNEKIDGKVVKRAIEYEIKR